MFGDILSRLSTDGIRFVVTGGVAVRFHGYERPVEDLDIVVARDRTEASAVMRSLMALGFVPTVPLHLSHVPLLTFLDARGRRVDVNGQYAIPFPELLDRAATLTLQDRDIRMISRDDLIAVKRRRGRGYDLDDVAGLVAANLR